MIYRGHAIDENDDLTPVRIQKQLIDIAIKEKKYRENAITRLKAKPELWAQSLRYLTSTQNPLVAEWVRIINSMTAKEFLQKYENGNLDEVIEVNYGQLLEVIPFSLTEQRIARNIVTS